MISVTKQAPSITATVTARETKREEILAVAFGEEGVIKLVDNVTGLFYEDVKVKPWMYYSTFTIDLKKYGFNQVLEQGKFEPYATSDEVVVPQTAVDFATTALTNAGYNPTYDANTGIFTVSAEPVPEPVV